MLEQNRRVLGLVPPKLQERLGAERGVRGDGDALFLRELEKRRLNEVRVVLDLQRRRADLCVSQQIQDQRALEVGNADVLRQPLLVYLLHRGPRLLDAGRAELNVVLAREVPARRIAHRGVDVLEGDGEVHDVEVEVVDAPVGKLLAADGLDLIAVVKGVPEFGDDEELFSLHDAFLDGASDTLSGLFLVAVICAGKSALVQLDGTGGEDIPHAPSNNL